jgi:hypothetical protein
MAIKYQIIHNGEFDDYLVELTVQDEEIIEEQQKDMYEDLEYPQKGALVYGNSFLTPLSNS